MRKLTILLTKSILLILISMLFTNCSNNQPQKKVTIQEIPVIKVIQHDVPIYDTYVGQIYGAKDIAIRARAEGILESIEFKEGSRVKKGQLLYTIDPQSLEAASNAQKSKVTEAQTQLSKARSDLNRIKPLAESRAVSQSDLDGAQAAYDAALANLKAAKANLRSSDINLSYTKVYAPIDGIIGETNAQVGDFVGRNPNPIILNTVSKTDSVIVKFSITESQYITLARRYGGKTKRSAKDRADVELDLADGSTYEYKGKVDFIDRNVDESTGSIMIQATFPNPEGLLRPGLYSKVKVKTGPIKDAIIIPQRCLMELQGQMSVFIVDDSNKVVSLPVTIGRKAGDLAAISKGLEPGDILVIDALQKVRVNSVIKPTPIEFESKVFPKIKFENK